MKTQKRKAESNTAADVESCTAARHMFMKSMPQMHETCTSKIVQKCIKWKACKRREMHVPSFKHTGRAKAKHKCRFTYTGRAHGASRTHDASSEHGHHLDLPVGTPRRPLDSWISMPAVFRAIWNFWPPAWLGRTYDAGSYTGNQLLRCISHQLCKSSWSTFAKRKAI